MKVALLKAFNFFLLLQIALMCLSLAFVDQALMAWWTDSALNSDEPDLLLMWSPPVVSALVLVAVITKEFRLESISTRLMLNISALLVLFAFAYAWLYWSLLYV
ncbi:hypothetical protein [Limnobacter sp.]|uniref:hypothetical protein n=1 Tax=Limnobacter sp. TaxID=2003368 RepID=UPI002FE2EDB1